VQCGGVSLMRSAVTVRSAVTSVSLYLCNANGQDW